MPTPPVAAGVVVNASEAAKWKQGEYDVWQLSGKVEIQQSGNVWRGKEAIIWVNQPLAFDEPTELIVHMEGTTEQPVRIELYDAKKIEKQVSAPPLARQQTPHWFGKLQTMGGIDWQTAKPKPEPMTKPGVFARALVRFAQEAPSISSKFDSKSGRYQDGKVKPAQFSDAQFSDSQFSQAQFSQLNPFETLAPSPQPTQQQELSFRRIQLLARQGAGLQGEVVTTPAGEDVGVLSGGLNLIISGINAPQAPGGLAGPNGQVDKIDLEADRAVVWTTGGPAFAGGQFEQRAEDPLEIYLEGNIVVRQGDRTIYANRMFYDARRKTGIILDAELLTPLPEFDGYQYRGLVRLKADALRQLDDSRYVANGALFTTSRLEEPTYSLRADNITFDDRQIPIVDPFTGQQKSDPFTGAPLYDHQQMATSESNRLYLGDVPVLYWPRLATDLTEPSYYISDFQAGNDAIFGFQVLTAWDVYQLLGTEKPKGTDWDVEIDYLSERGLGYGTTYEYSSPEFLGTLGPAQGRSDLWFIDDNDTDNLGFGRRNIDPEKSFRGRAFWSHRQEVQDGLLAGWTTQAQVGWISDRTFLEQYYEQEWDTGGDQPTGVRLKRTIGNQSLSIEANGQINDFFTETQWLPRLDHYLMGKDLGGEMFTWFAHSQIGYADLNPASTPTEPTLAAQHFAFPWEAQVEGERIVTRQEIDLPIDLEPYGAPVKIVPYFLGELAHWGEDLTGEDLQRGYLQTGIRASAPFWAVNPNVRDPLFNLDGLAHKVVFDAEVSYADASRSFTELPLYDEIEDNSLEEIRRRIFNPTIPATSDPRFYLIRSGIQGNVAAPTTELADDLTVARFGMRHRLQTKRGAPGNQRVVDWLVFDTNASFFPEDDRDNLGEDFGLIDYDMQWHIGDRFTVLSDGFLDLFTDGLQTFSVGLAANRPSRGNAYIGYRSIRGPFNSDIVTARLNYRLGPKWIGSATAIIDFGEVGNIGQSFALSRIGESIITTVGFNVDESKDNVGLRLLVEPRFLPKTSLTRRTSIDVPPAGAYGLE